MVDGMFSVILFYFIAMSEWFYCEAGCLPQLQELLDVGCHSQGTVAVDRHKLLGMYHSFKFSSSWIPANFPTFWLWPNSSNVSNSPFMTSIADFCELMKRSWSGWPLTWNWEIISKWYAKCQILLTELCCVFIVFNSMITVRLQLLLWPNNWTDISYSAEYFKCHWMRPYKWVSECVQSSNVCLSVFSCPCCKDWPHFKLSSINFCCLLLLIPFPD